MMKSLFILGLHWVAIGRIIILHLIRSFYKEIPFKWLKVFKVRALIWLGLLTCTSDHLDIRTYPLNLVFTEKAFLYRLKYPDRFAKEDSLTTRKIQGITLAFPLQLKFSSDRINNFKVYLMGGGKLEYDFAANAGEKNAEKLMKLNKLDYGIEAGIGFHFYFPVFVLSPELKLGWGLKNVHSRDANLKFSNVIDQIKSRTLTLSLIIE
ncbi:MAG: outer membrane beta-barrel protein [Sphingobacteriales bacterium]|nr:outer membrane beta-barrel protein [Sphingobacteriales bacterium]